MLRRLVLGTLGWYRQYRGLRPDACRYSPSCSAYTYQAVDVHGPAKGLYLGTRRVARCHPWGGQGYDPVPGAHGAETTTERAGTPEELRHSHA